MKRRATQSGFTIVELLIVVVVIAIVASITIIAYGGIQARARDATRIDKIKHIAKAIELYRIDNGRYPAIQDGSGNESSCGSLTDNWGHCDRNKALSDALAPYMTLDPTSLSSATQGNYYYYYHSWSFDNYQHFGLSVPVEGNVGQNDGGYISNAYEVGDLPAYCAAQYTGTDANWKYTARATLCVGGN